jgi:hypothetical protein
MRRCLRRRQLSRCVSVISGAVALTHQASSGPGLPPVSDMDPDSRALPSPRMLTCSHVCMCMCVFVCVFDLCIR